jgi:signal transduction histidine kinase/DNA-binding response OmpR family regulator
MKRYLIIIVYLLIIYRGTAIGNNDNLGIKSIEYCQKYYSTLISKDNPDSVLYYANILIAQYDDLNDTINKLEYYDQTCYYLIKRYQYRLVPDLLKRYISDAEDSGKEYFIARAYFLAGRFFSLANINNEISLEYYNRSLTIFGSNENYADMALVYYDLGLYYSHKDNNEERALTNYLKSVDINKKQNNYDQLYVTYRSLGELYRHNYKDYENGKTYYLKALQVATENNDSIGMADAYTELGCINAQYNKTDSVLSYYFKALAIVPLDFTYMHISVYYETMGDLENALFYLLKTNQTKIYGFENYIPESLLKIAELEEKLGYPDRAIKRYKKYIQAKDSLDRQIKTQEFSELELKFELENIDKKTSRWQKKVLAELQRQKIIRNSFIIFACFLLIVFFLIYRNYSNKQKANRKIYEANKKLHEADKMKLRFFTNVSHELRTPLTLLVSPLERICKKYTGTEDEQQINTILKNANKLKNLIDQQLDISKIDSKNLALEKDYHDFNKLFITQASMFNSLAEDKHINFQVFPENKELVFSFDKERIGHVITNLLSNALKFTPEKGKVEARTYKNDNSVIMSIKDTGIGIPEKDIDKIFERFYQANNTNGDSYGGTGLGLNIVKEYIELHKGNISVKSKLGEGSEFIVKIPLDQYLAELDKKSSIELLESIEEKTSIKSENNTISRANETILIVEDNKDLRNYLTSIFQERYKVIEASNGELGKQIAVNENPDIVISDVMMPICDGFQFTKYLKSKMETSHIPIILLTAKAQQHDKIAGYQQGADDYISKPFNEEELKLKVHNILLTRKQYREKFKKNFIIKPSTVETHSLDEKFLIQVTNVVETHISNSNFTVEELCNDVSMSRRSLYGKLKALTDMNPSQFIRTIRLKRASQLLSQKAGSISEIAFKTGFENTSYFTKCFKETFNKLPSEYPE